MSRHAHPEDDRIPPTPRSASLSTPDSERDIDTRDERSTIGNFQRQINLLMRRISHRDVRLREAEESRNEMRARYRNRVRAAEERTQRREQTISNLQQEIIHLQHNLAATQALLQTRTAELQDAQTYLTLTDTHSHADILRLVEDINNTVFQSSAAIADALVDISRWEDKHARDHDMSSGTRDRVVHDLGEPLVALLENGDHSRDPICIQIALQAYMTHFARWLASTWNPTAPDEPENLLHSVEKEMRRKESQSISGRWRSLTRQYLKRCGMDNSVEVLSSHLRKRIRAVLSLSGFNGTGEDIKEAVHDFDGKVAHVITQCLQLRSTIGEEMISCSFIPFVPSCGSRFLPREMEDAYGEGDCTHLREEESAPIVVLCAVALGLQREERGQDPRQTGILSPVMMLKSKVALKTTIEELLPKYAVRSNWNTTH